MSPCENDIQAPKKACSPPELLRVGYATELERSERQSTQVAKRIRQMIDESGGSLSCGPAKECRRLQVNLSLVSKQFRKLYHVTIRAYSRQVRMKTAEKLLKDCRRLNVDETARMLGYSFTSGFSRCFQKAFGKRPKHYQMQSGTAHSGNHERGIVDRPHSLLHR